MCAKLGGSFSMKFDHVYHTYSKKTPYQFEALKDVTVTLKEGTFTAIVGHTGSGKSTLIQHVNALLLPTSGQLFVHGMTIDANKPPKKVKALRQYAGLVFQFPEYQLFEETVEQDVMFGPLNFGIPTEEAKKRAHEALTLVGLDASFYQRSPFELSGGERRRVAIAGILAIQPKVLILDEPTAGLDPQGAKVMMQLFVSLFHQGMTIVLVTHDMDLVYEYTDHVVVMQDGHVIHHSPTLDFFLTPIPDYSVSLPPFLDVLIKLQAKGITIPFERIKNLDQLVNYLKEIKRWPA